MIVAVAIYDEDVEREYEPWRPLNPARIEAILTNAAGEIIEPGHYQCRCVSTSVEHNSYGGTVFRHEFEIVEYDNGNRGYG